MLDGGDCRDADASSAGAVLAQSGLWKFSRGSVDWSDSLYVPSFSSSSTNFLSQVTQHTYRRCNAARKTYSFLQVFNHVPNRRQVGYVLSPLVLSWLRGCFCRCFCPLSFCLSVGPLLSCLALPGLVVRSCLLMSAPVSSCLSVCFLARLFVSFSVYLCFSLVVYCWLVISFVLPSLFLLLKEFTYFHPNQVESSLIEFDETILDWCFLSLANDFYM